MTNRQCLVVLGQVKSIQSQLHHRIMFPRKQTSIQGTVLITRASLIHLREALAFLLRPREALAPAIIITTLLDIQINQEIKVRRGRKGKVRTTEPPRPDEPIITSTRIDLYHHQLISELVKSNDIKTKITIVRIREIITSNDHGRRCLDQNQGMITMI